MYNPLHDLVAQGVSCHGTTPADASQGSIIPSFYDIQNMPNSIKIRYIQCLLMPPSNADYINHSYHFTQTLSHNSEIANFFV